MCAGLVTGGSCALRERFSASAFWSDVRTTGATVGFCVFSIPMILAKAEPRDDDRDHTLRVFYNARHDEAFEERFGVRCIEAYGLTEAGAAMYVRPGEVPPPGSCGRVSEDWEVRLVDDDDVDVPVGEIGEIVLRPRFPGLITPGYLNKPEATAQAFRNLWFHTGDLASIDADGYYTFRDRKKDAIRRRGENVSSWEVEQVLMEHPAIAEAAAIPYPSPLGEDDVRVAVALREGAELTPEQLVDYCVSRMPDFMVPRYIEFLPGAAAHADRPRREVPAARDAARRGRLRPRRSTRGPLRRRPLLTESPTAELAAFGVAARARRGAGGGRSRGETLGAGHARLRAARLDAPVGADPARGDARPRAACRPCPSGARGSRRRRRRRRC